MYTVQPKKMLILNILDILNKHSDENHPLSQQDIIDILAKDYMMTVERKSVRRNLFNLIDFGYDLNYTETKRINKKGEEESMFTDWYIVRNFTDSELRLLIDSLLFAGHISHSNKKELIEKIEKLSNKHFSSKIKHIHTTSSNFSGNKELFYTIEVIDEAIASGNQIAFYYNDIGIDKKLHPRKYSNGEPHRYVINPYQLITANAHYYLICNYDKYDNISNYRVDRISGIEKLSSKRKPLSKTQNGKETLDLTKYRTEHFYMFTGESETVEFKTDTTLLNDLYDWFGEDMSITSLGGDKIKVRVKANIQAMRRWALQYSLYVRVITPQSLVEVIREDILTAVGNYEEVK